MCQSYPQRERPRQECNIAKFWVPDPGQSETRGRTSHSTWNCCLCLAILAFRAVSSLTVFCAARFSAVFTASDTSLGAVLRAACIGQWHCQQGKDVLDSSSGSNFQMLASWQQERRSAWRPCACLSAHFHLICLLGAKQQFADTEGIPGAKAALPGYVPVMTLCTVPTICMLSST